MGIKYKNIIIKIGQRVASKSEKNKQTKQNKKTVSF